jgi:formamidopyrimidine-DNA glycosylase
VPEIPDLTVYLDHLERRTRGAELSAIRLGSPFVLRSVAPPVEAVCPRAVVGWRRLAKQLVLELADDYYVVIHLMISGRLQWHDTAVTIPRRNGLAALDFSSGTLIFTEASKKRRASLRLLAGAAALQVLDPGGLDALDASFDAFAERLRGAHHTVKRALTDQHILAGIGNAYSDEILLRARLSPFKPANGLGDDELRALYDACMSVLNEWIERLRQQAGRAFPTKVTAFHSEMAVHGRYRQPCPVCGSPVQRIVYAENESNYCATCQTGGRLLADRSLSRLLKASWPKRLEDLE